MLSDLERRDFREVEEVDDVLDVLVVPVEIAHLSLSLGANRLDKLRNDDVEVADDAVVRDLEDRRVLVRVDREDLRGVLHAGEVLDRAGDAAADHQRGTHRDARLPDLPLVLAVAEVDRRAASAHRTAEDRGQVVEEPEVLLRAHARAAAHIKTNMNMILPLSY